MSLLGWIALGVVIGAALTSWFACRAIVDAEAEAADLAIRLRTEQDARRERGMRIYTAGVGMGLNVAADAFAPDKPNSCPACGTEYLNQPDASATRCCTNCGWYRRGARRRGPDLHRAVDRLVHRPASSFSTGGDND